MSKIILDDATAAQLAQLQGPALLCDKNGKVLGNYRPKFDPSEWEAVGPEISKEELDRRENANQRRYTTAEVIAHLEKLKCTP
jgi:hypothetical protein